MYQFDKNQSFITLYGKVYGKIYIHTLLWGHKLIQTKGCCNIYQHLKYPTLYDPAFYFQGSRETLAHKDTYSLMYYFQVKDYSSIKRTYTHTVRSQKHFE